MRETDMHSGDSNASRDPIALVNRRHFLQATGTIGVATGLAGFGGSVAAADHSTIRLAATTVEEEEKRPPGHAGGRGPPAHAGQRGPPAHAGQRGPPAHSNAGGKSAAQYQTWLGLAPENIADEENPTLELIAGEEYTIEWENWDGEEHDFRIEDADGNILYETPSTAEEGGSESITVTASAEMATYRCSFHPDDMWGEIAIGQPAYFAVSNLEPSELTVEQGETFDIAATITNTGDNPGTQEIELRLDDEIIDSQELSLDPDEVQIVSFDEVATGQLDEGEYTVSIASEDEWEAGTLTVEVTDPAYFAVSELDPETIAVEQGETFTIAATITNTGDQTGTQEIELLINDDLIDSQEISLDPGQDETVSFDDVDTSELDEGEYTVTISSDDEWESGTLTVGVPDGEVNILILSQTDGFRHGAIPFANDQIMAMADDIAAATGAEEVSFTVVDDDIDDALDMAEFPVGEELMQYDTLVWNSATGGPLNSEQQDALVDYIQAGGGYAGIHAASDTHYDWDWYHDLVGAFFAGHPAIQDLQVNNEDQVHPSTNHVPRPWTIYDEPYDFDRNPRGDIHILQTLEEDSYDGAGMANGRVDHPISWCHHYQGGRAWYTGLGHTEEAFESNVFLDMVLGGILWSAGFVEGDAEATVWDAYEQVELAGPDDLNTGNQAGPMSMSIAPDGRVFFVEREANVSVIDPNTFEVTTALEREFWFNLEDGGLGVALDPDFAENGYLYLYYSPVTEALDPDDEMPYNLLSRFEVDGNNIDPDTEVEILRVHQQRDSCCHSGGELQFGPDGALHLSTGDNVTPFESSGYTPIDERTTDPNTNDAQGTAGDASDLRGNILRIIPHEDGSYSVPEDNLYTEAQGWGDEIAAGLVRPEIFAQGFRNPFRFDVDDETGWVYMADYGPDSGSWSADRGPIGIREYNQIQEAGNYGWPFTRARNYPYIDYDFETGESIGPFDPENLINDSVNNDGIEALPPAEEATFYVATNWGNYLNPPDHDWGDIWEVPDQVPYPEVTDRAPNGGPLVRLPGVRADTALSPFFDGKWIIAEWNNGNFLHVTFDDNDELLEISDWSPNLEIRDLSSPHDMEIGPEGRFHYIEWGDGFSGNDPGIYRIDYLPEGVGTVAYRFSLESPSVSQGASTTATATLTNTTDEPVTDIEFAATVDDDEISISALDALSYDELEPGESQTVSWEVAVDEEAAGGEYAITGTVSYIDDEGEPQQVSRVASLTVIAPLEVPFALDSGGESTDDDIVIQDLTFDTWPHPSIEVVGEGPNVAVHDGTPVSGTDFDSLYQSEHWGSDLGYHVAVPNGTYDVRLHFAEVWTGTIGDDPDTREFTLWVQDELIAENLNLVEEYGFAEAVMFIVRDVEITDGVLRIESETHSNNTKFSGFEIRDDIEEIDPGDTPLSAPVGIDLSGEPAEPQSDWPVIIEGLSFGETEELEQVEESWDDEPEQSFGGGTDDTPEAIANTEYDALYQTARWGYDLAYDIFLENGSYDVVLHFAELFDGNIEDGEGARVFDIVVQGETVVEGYDPYAEGDGGFAASSVAIDGVEVDSQQLVIEFPTLADHSQCCGIEIREELVPVSAPYGLNTGGEPEEPASDLPVVIRGLEFNSLVGAHDIRAVRVSAEEGVNTAETDAAIAETDHDALYQTEQWGEDLSYEIAMDNGTYDVTVHLAEIFWSGVGDRIFSISVQGELIAEELDIYEEVGGDTAMTITAEDVNVDEGLLTITTETIQDNSKISGIEIRSADKLEDGVVAHFPLDTDEPTNEVTGNNAEVIGSPVSGVDGVVNHAWEFDMAGAVGPVEDALESEPLPLNGESATVGAWFNFTEFEEWARAPYQVGGSAEDFPQAGWSTEWDQDNNAIISQFAADGSPGRSADTGTIPLDPETWYFVVTVIDGDSYRLHAFDEQGEVAESPVTGSGNRSQSAEEPLIMMAGDGRETAGRLDEVWGYNYALSTAEVVDLYEQSFTTDPPDGPVESYEFFGDIDGWIGISPPAIDGEVNPTLELEEGQRYEIGWTDGDGYSHNIEIRDADGVVVGDLSTELTPEPDEDQWLEFTASTEMATYRCAPHPSMEGDIVVGDPVDDDPSVSFVAPQDSDTAANGVVLRMNADNFEIEEAGEVNEGAGHFHVIVDEGPVPEGEMIPLDEEPPYYHFSDGRNYGVIDLAEGSYELTLQAGDGEHYALDLTDQVGIAVEDSWISIEEPQDGATVSSPVQFEFSASDNLDVDEAGVLNQAGGHYHLIINEEPVPTGETIPEGEEDTYLHFGDGTSTPEVDLPPGEYEVVLQMGDEAHLALPEIDSITLTVE